MDESPIPEYLVDMLREAGEVDENGKAINDAFDPYDEDIFGTKRPRGATIDDAVCTVKQILRIFYQRTENVSWVLFTSRIFCRRLSRHLLRGKLRDGPPPSCSFDSLHRGRPTAGRPTDPRMSTSRSGDFFDHRRTPSYNKLGTHADQYPEYFVHNIQIFMSKYLLELAPL